MIIVDTGALIALLNADDRHHAAAKDLFETRGAEWLIPWAVLPELDYLAAKHLGSKVARAFIEDVRDGAFQIDAQIDKDLGRSLELQKKYATLSLGLVDTIVMAQAERHHATAILTTDGRHFRAVKLAISPPPTLPLLDA